jgi:hypothetical protein
MPGMRRALKPGSQAPPGRKALEELSGQCVLNCFFAFCLMYGILMHMTRLRECGRIMD